jgi:hypothetical protein
VLLKTPKELIIIGALLFNQMVVLMLSRVTPILVGVIITMVVKRFMKAIAVFKIVLLMLNVLNGLLVKVIIVVQ